MCGELGVYGRTGIVIVGSMILMIWWVWGICSSGKASGGIYSIGGVVDVESMEVVVWQV